MNILRTKGSVVFVASGWNQKEAAHALMLEVEKRGLQIARDWTTGANGLTKREMSVRDVEAMCKAQVLVAVMTLQHYEYKGTWTEVGMALGRGIPVVLVSPFVKEEEAVCAKNVYFHHPSFTRFKNAEELLAAIDSVQ